MRGDDSLCQSPSGTVGVRDGLLIASFVLSLLVLSGWLVCLTILSSVLTLPHLRGMNVGIQPTKMSGWYR